MSLCYDDPTLGGPLPVASDQRVEVIVEDGPEGGPLADLVRRTALVALGRTRCDDPDDDGLSGRSVGVTILLTDDDTLRDLNRQFADEDKVTDVLAFRSAAQSSPGTQTACSSTLGDIAISIAAGAPAGHRSRSFGGPGDRHAHGPRGAPPVGLRSC